MNKNVFIWLTMLCLLTHITRTIYEILKHRKTISPSRTSFVIIFVNMLLLWISWFMLCPLDPSGIKMPLLLQYLGIALISAGVIIFFTALLTIKALENYQGGLITHGIYSKLRHPMYLAFILWLTGMPLQSGGIYSFMLCQLFILNVLYWRYLEEKELLERFPDYYLYTKTTWF